MPLNYYLCTFKATLKVISMVMQSVFTSKAAMELEDIKAISAGTQLTLVEFSKLMKVSKNTAYMWCKKYLQRGKHYVMLGRVIRVIYSQELLVELQNNFNETVKKNKRQKAAKAAKKPASSINWDY